MKIFSTLLLATLVTPVIAKVPSPDMDKVVRALLNSPNLSKKILEASATDLSSYTIKKTDKMTTVNMVFETDCYCSPVQKAYATVWETYPDEEDAPSVFKSKIRFIDIEEK